MSHLIQSRQPPVLLVFKATCLAAVCSLLILLVIRLFGAVNSPLEVAMAVGGLVVGYLGADFFSGTVHWICDTFFEVDTPIIGKRLIFPFRDHHDNPRAITTFGLLEQDGSNYVMLLPILLLVIFGGSNAPLSPLAIFGSAALAGFGAGSTATNLFHKWAHAAEVPALVSFLQRKRLILSPDAHNVHHTTYVGGYCVTSGWMNALLDRIHFFAHAETIVRLVSARLRSDTLKTGAMERVSEQ